MPTKKDQQPTFETAIERLEAIVEQMEADSLPLEELLVHYEEGLKLVKFCSEKLDAAEKRIEIIARDATGKARFVEFETKPAAATANGGDSASAPASAAESARSISRDPSEPADSSGSTNEGVRLF